MIDGWRRTRQQYWNFVLFYRLFGKREQQTSEIWYSTIFTLKLSLTVLQLWRILVVGILIKKSWIVDAENCIPVNKSNTQWINPHKFSMIQFRSNKNCNYFPILSRLLVQNLLFALPAKFLYKISPMNSHETSRVAFNQKKKSNFVVFFRKHLNYLQWKLDFDWMLSI